ncbi:MAG TPA: OsmC family protein [Cyclobacteriaceae bacterium]|nr:OsmC family protein [Cyclobacteriaceae bacterium]
MSPHYYSVDVTWNEKRQGIMCSPELSSGQLEGEGGCIQVATPPQFPGGIAGIWSPEHLFTASAASCLMTTFLAVAENSNLEFSAFTCKARGKLDLQDRQYRMTEIVLEPHITILREEDRRKAERVIRKAEASCLITHSVRSDVMVNPVIVVDSMPAAVNDVEVEVVDG